MGARDPDRIPRLGQLHAAPPGRVLMAVCQGCGHMAPLPLATLLARFGDLCPVERVMAKLACSM